MFITEASRSLIRDIFWQFKNKLLPAIDRMLDIIGEEETDPIFFYVDKDNGNDGNIGTMAKPFQTLDKALRTVPSFQKNEQPAIIRLVSPGNHNLAGDYSVGHPAGYKAYDNVVMIEGTEWEDVLVGTVTAFGDAHIIDAGVNRAMDEDGLHFIQIRTGPLTGVTLKVKSNTAGPGTQWNTAFFGFFGFGGLAGGETFAIVKPASNIRPIGGVKLPKSTIILRKVGGNIAGFGALWPWNSSVLKLFGVALDLTGGFGSLVANQDSFMTTLYRGELADYIPFEEAWAGLGLEGGSLGVKSLSEMETFGYVNPTVIDAQQGSTQWLVDNYGPDAELRIEPTCAAIVFGGYDRFQLKSIACKHGPGFVDASFGLVKDAPAAGLHAADEGVIKVDDVQVVDSGGDAALAEDGGLIKSVDESASGTPFAGAGNAGVGLNVRYGGKAIMSKGTTVTGAGGDTMIDETPAGPGVVNTWAAIDADPDDRVIDDLNLIQLRD